MKEEMFETILLEDEEGIEEEYEILDLIEMNGGRYVVLMPCGSSTDIAEDNDAECGCESCGESCGVCGLDDEEGEVVILKIESDEKGDENFVTIEDEKEMDQVFDEFNKRMEETCDCEEC